MLNALERSTFQIILLIVSKECDGNRKRPSITRFFHPSRPAGGAGRLGSPNLSTLELGQIPLIMKPISPLKPQIRSSGTQKSSPADRLCCRSLVLPITCAGRQSPKNSFSEATSPVLWIPTHPSPLASDRRGIESTN